MHQMAVWIVKKAGGIEVRLIRQLFWSLYSPLLRLSLLDNGLASRTIKLVSESAFMLAKKVAMTRFQPSCNK